MDSNLTADVTTPASALPTQRLPLALGVGLLAALAGAATWAVVTVTTGYQIGWMAVGIGFLVGLVIRKVGQSAAPIFGIAGATLALLGCVAGNLLAVVGFVARDEAVPFMSVLARLTPSTIPSVLIGSFDAMDLLFYAIAMYEGYKLSLAR